MVTMRGAVTGLWLAITAITGGADFGLDLVLLVVGAILLTLYRAENQPRSTWRR